jgi:hypothetical protein
MYHYGGSPELICSRDFYIDNIDLILITKSRSRLAYKTSNTRKILKAAVTLTLIHFRDDGIRVILFS